MMPPAMEALRADAVDAASRRLRGQLVAVPLVGGLRLPGFACAGDLRLVPEVLQPGGSLAYRGALHQLLRQLGGLHGVVLAAPAPRLLSLALAAHSQRLPMLATATAALPEAVAAPLRELGCELAVADAEAAAALARKRGYLVLGDAAAPDFRLGVATSGRDLAAMLPAETQTVWVPAPFAAAVAAGLAAAGRKETPAVVEVGVGPVPAGLGAALQQGHRLVAGEAALATLAAALAAPAGSTCAAVLSD